MTTLVVVGSRLAAIVGTDNLLGTLAVSLPGQNDLPTDERWDWASNIPRVAAMKSNEFTTKTDAQLSEAQRGFVSQVDKMSLALDGQGRLVLLTQNQVKAWANKFSPYKGAGVSNGAAATVTEVPASTAKNQSPPVLETSKERLEAVGETPPVAAGARAVWNAVVDLSNNATYEAVTERCLQDAAFNGKSDAAGRVKWTIEDLMKRGLIRLT